MKKKIIAGVAVLVSSMATMLQAEELFVQAGQVVSSSSAGVFGAGVGFALPWSFQEGRLASRLDLSLAHADTRRGGLAQVAVMPVLRYQPQTVGFFAEFGLGAAYVSRTHWDRRHDMGSRLNFASRLGAGYDFGAYALSLNVSHISNAGLKQPNDGADIVDLRLLRAF